MLTAQSGIPAGLGVFPTNRPLGFKHPRNNHGYRAGYMADLKDDAIVITTNSENGNAFLAEITPCSRLPTGWASERPQRSTDCHWKAGKIPSNIRCHACRR
ncbi:MAG: hypothetical protein ACPGVU_17635 [Limisphaerales bacterium]